MNEEGLRLVLVSETGELRAVLRVVPGSEPPDAGAIARQLEEHGWTAQALEPALVANFLDTCRQALTPPAADGPETTGPDGAAAAPAGEAAQPAPPAAAASTPVHAQAAPAVEAGPAGVSDPAAGPGTPADFPAAPAQQASQAPPGEPGLQPSGDGTVSADEADSVDALMASARHADIDLPIGAVQDGALELEVHPDNMSVLAVLHPPRGGRPVDRDAVLAALAERGVVFGIDQAAIDRAVAAGNGQPVTVAAGSAPTPPQPTRFLSQLDALKRQVDKEADSARVDFRELGNLILVNPGELLMKRVPAVPGVAGTDVFGRPVEPAPIEDLPYADGLSGVVVDEGAPELLRAAIAGAPVVVSRGVNVNPVVEVEAVDIATGNITFDGSLKVRGDIKTGMVVRVTGDVVVGGTVEAAQIEAGGSITVAGGVIGAVEGGAAAGEGRKAHLHCAGTMRARFINNAYVSAGQDVQVEREIMQSEVLAGGAILAGPRGSTQGSISGGHCRALRAIRAGTLGTMGGVPTYLQVGLNPHANAQKAALEQERRRLAEERHKLDQLLGFLKAHPQKALENDLGARTQRTHAKVLADLAELEARESQLAAELVQTEGATIEAVKRLYSGVHLQIGNRLMEIIDDVGVGGKALLVEDKVELR